MFLKEETLQKWKFFWKQVDEFDKRITDTNPFSRENYSTKEYKNFRDFYQPKPEHVVVWIDDD